MKGSSRIPVGHCSGKAYGDGSSESAEQVSHGIWLGIHLEIGFTLPTEETIIMAAIIKSAANADNSEAILFLLNMITLNPSSSKKYKNYKLSIAKSTGLNNIK